jgi:hypothetical protein
MEAGLHPSPLYEGWRSPHKDFFLLIFFGFWSFYYYSRYEISQRVMGMTCQFSYMAAVTWQHAYVVATPLAI